MSKRRTFLIAAGIFLLVLSLVFLLGDRLLQLTSFGQPFKGVFVPSVAENFGFDDRVGRR